MEGKRLRDAIAETEIGYEPVELSQQKVWMHNVVNSKSGSGKSDIWQAFGVLFAFCLAAACAFYVLSAMK